MTAPLETYERNGFTITIEHDYDVPSPHEESPGCLLVMSHRRYSWPNDAEINFSIFDGWDDIAAELRMHQGALAVTPVWAYDHSDVSFSTGERRGQFADRWDSGQAGLAYITRETWAEIQGTEWTGSDEQVAEARALIAADVETYGMWARGDTYAFEITGPDGEQVDACGGFIGWDSVTSAANDEADRREHPGPGNEDDDQEMTR